MTATVCARQARGTENSVKTIVFLPVVVLSTPPLAADDARESQGGQRKTTTGQKTISFKAISGICGGSTKAHAVIFVDFPLVKTTFVVLRRPPIGDKKHQ